MNTGVVGSGGGGGGGREQMGKRGGCKGVTCANMWGREWSVLHFEKN